MSRPNVLLVVMDTTRHANTLADGTFESLPALARLASEGTVFDGAVTTAPWTLPAHAAMFSGQYTTDHGTHGGTQYFDPDRAPLARRVRDAGYRTAAVSNNTWVTPEFGFADGFDDFYTRSEPFPSGDDPAAAREAVRTDPLGALRDAVADGTAASTAGNLLYDRFLRDRGDDGARLSNWRIGRWLDAHDGDEPFFLFANYIEPHLPYTPPAEFLPPGFDSGVAERVAQDPWAFLMGETDIGERGFETLEALYEAELRYLDARLGDLFDRLRADGTFDETAIVVVGDHGENVGDHGLMDHQFSLHDTLLRVPLVVKPPAGTGPTVGSVSAPVETRDVFPTLLELAGADAPTHPTVSDRSLLESVCGRADAHREHAVSEYLHPRPSPETLRERFPDSDVDVDRYDRSLRCIRTPRWKYVQATDGREQLYDVAADPDETANLADDRPRVRDRLRRTLRAERGRFDRPAEPADDGTDRHEPPAGTERRLDALGYI
ncbi:sulfatase [Candidatus Halobonum tyrrellensis]|uniref:Putative sulfatase n=1 Tax=Candidatus Halobonum tyrrellensis G22 TaxID=1324957 RepID=V4HBK2_9EURY|nr:sulfatase [Candidatus Halobonum tyrrellensis]ESP87423.1 putative sulfatase [Candidatus Halobonum tyrrellensis G22]